MKTTIKAAFMALAALAAVCFGLAVQDDSDAFGDDSVLQYFGADTGGQNAYAFMYDSVYDPDDGTDESVLLIMNGLVQTNLYAVITDGVEGSLTYDPLPASGEVYIYAPAYKTGSTYTIEIFEHIDPTTPLAHIELAPAVLAFSSTITENVTLDGTGISFTDSVYQYPSDITKGKTFVFAEDVEEGSHSFQGYAAGALPTSATVELILMASSYDATNQYYLIAVAWSDSQTFTVTFDWNKPSVVTDRWVYTGSVPDPAATADVSVPADMTVDTSVESFVPTTAYGLKGYEFAGWYTLPAGGTQTDASTDIYDAILNDHREGTVTVDLTNTTFTLYAHWTARSYTVTYGVDHTDLTDPVVRTISYDALAAVENMASLGATDIDDGYIFSHWTYALSTDPDTVVGTLELGSSFTNLDQTFGFADGATEFVQVAFVATPVYDYAVTFTGIEGFDVNVHPYAALDGTTETARDAGYEFVVKATETEYLIKIKYSDMMYEVTLGTVTGAVFQNSSPEYDDDNGWILAKIVKDASDATAVFDQPITVAITVESQFYSVSMVLGGTTYKSGHTNWIDDTTVTDTDHMFEITWSNLIPTNGFGILQIDNGSAMDETYSFTVSQDSGAVTIEQIRSNIWKITPTADSVITFTYEEGGYDITDFYILSMTTDKVSGIIKSYDGPIDGGAVTLEGMAYRQDGDVYIYSLIRSTVYNDPVYYVIDIGSTSIGTDTTGSSTLGGDDAYLFEITPVSGYSLYAANAKFTATDSSEIETALVLVSA